MIAFDKENRWFDGIKALIHPRVSTMLFFGISAGIPLLLIFSSLSLWLNEAGVERSAVTFFSWAALGYSFKFVWAPLVDCLAIPFLSQWLGRRRAWLLLSQSMVISAICWMASIDPAVDSLILMAWAAVFLGFSAATQDIVIDAYRIESAALSLQPLMASSYIAGYRIGMVLSGAGGLYLASHFGSTLTHYNYQAWQFTYLIMALLMGIGVITTLWIKEPEQTKSTSSHQQRYISFFILFLSAVLVFIATLYLTADSVKSLHPMLATALANDTFASLLLGSVRLILAIVVVVFTVKLLVYSGLVEKNLFNQTYAAPIKDFFSRYQLSIAILILALIGLYRVSDIVLGVVANLFYQDLGFSKPVIAGVVKSFGLLMTIAGGFLGGILALRFGVMRVLLLGAILSALTNLLFILLAQIGPDLTTLYWVIAADNLSAGLASAAFVAFLSSLTNISFTAMQYAIFSSLMTLLPKIFGGYSGTMVTLFGYQGFFLITTLMTIPVLGLIFFVSRSLKFK